VSRYLAPIFFGFWAFPAVAHLDGADDEYLAGPGGVEIALAVPKWDLRLIDLDDPLERFALGVNH